MSDALLDAPVVSTQEDDSDRDAWLAAWAIVLLLLGANAASVLPLAQRRRARRRLRDAFERGAGSLAQRVSAGQLTVDAWRVEAEQLIADYMRQMAVAGAGTLPNAAVQARAAAELQRQRAFLDSFAAALAAGGLSVAGIAARTRLYGASGWGLHWLAQGSSAPSYAVDLWVSRDDNRTCAVCASYSGRYFLPGQGPMPGLDCLGAGHCRCERRQVIDRAIWQRLTGTRP